MAGLHLGFRTDPKTGEPSADRLVVESGDLTTHGVIVGMTGSGKTGLGVVLIEEALLAGIPCLVLDPKGDMGNLALTFPDLDAASFRPWVNEDDARSEGVSLDEFAQRTATIWRKGLEGSGIGPDRIRELRAAAELAVYTPGSEAGIPLNVVGSLKAPTLSWDTEAETLREEIEGTVTSLLGLVGIAADPLSSREHVLLSSLIENAWRAGQDLDLGALIGQVVSPPIRKLGVFEIDSFAQGTIEVARAVAEVKGTTVIGGGDSIAAVAKAGVTDRITHISTGGGASLEFLGGRTLPGVAALK